MLKNKIINLDIHTTKTLFKNQICPSNKMLMHHYCYGNEGPGTKLVEDLRARDYPIYKHIIFIISVF